MNELHNFRARLTTWCGLCSIWCAWFECGIMCILLQNNHIKFLLMRHSSADALKLDHDACGNVDSMIVPCCGALRELRSGHYHKIVEITENAGKCLQEEYMVRS